MLFQEYELLARSGLFDAEYYVATNPDIAGRNGDPLLHYLESGCRQGRNPSRHFDTPHYLAQCSRLGDKPANALLHYLTIGASLGLTAHPGLSSPRVSPSLLCIDLPRIEHGSAVAPVRSGLSIVGWGIHADEAVAVEIALDGKRITSARCGLRRPDVATAHPGRDRALLSGYAAHLPPKSLTVGRHRVTVSLHSGGKQVAATDFHIDVQGAADVPGPWALRRAMHQSEVSPKLETLARLKWRPAFRVAMAQPRKEGEFDLARRTIESLARQTYARWELCLLPRDGKVTNRPQLNAIRSRLLADFEEVEAQIGWWDSPTSASSSGEPDPFIACIKPGDEYGCDALLELALASGVNRRADFLYCDERRLSPIDGIADAFFKPGWSPDLLLSTNYIGRSWWAKRSLLQRAGVGLAGGHSAYATALRLTEAADGIHHISKLLFASIPADADTASQERQALEAALLRRSVDSRVLEGRTRGQFRVKRAGPTGKVSIIIPTCAADDLVKTCIESLREHTAYRKYEVIGIENIPASKSKWKRWLRNNADVVIEARGKFNWSRCNNVAAARATGEYLLFLNDDIEIIEPDWLDAMLEQIQRPEVGVVGPLLLYPDLSVQHAGVMLDGEGRGRHAFRHLPSNDPGYFGLALMQRNVISVTGACLLTSKATFERLGRFEEAHAVVNNDLDYCLRAWRSGLINVYTPYARLIHHEMISRKHLEDSYDSQKFDARWRSVIALGDPYFNPNLSREEEQFSIEREPVQIVYAGHPVFARESMRRILVVKLDHIGDCITAIPALRRLKQHFPGARISVLAARATLSVWKAEPMVDEVIEFNFFHGRSGLGKVEVSEHDRRALQETLRARRFDLAIDLRKQPDSREVLQLSSARFLAGYDNHGRFPWLDVGLEWDEDVPLRPKRGHVSDDLIALADAVAAQSAPDRSAFIAAPPEPPALPKGERQRLFARPLICIHPAAGTPMRQWPAGKYSELIDLLLDVDKFNIALIGGKDETNLAEEVFAGTERGSQVFNLVGRFQLDDLPRLLARSALFVGNNSGPQHLAAALGVPTIGIHSGVVDAREWGPLGPRAVAIRRDMSCSPCFIEFAKDCPRAIACLTQLAVGEVFRACLRSLEMPDFSHPSNDAWHYKARCS